MSHPFQSHPFHQPLPASHPSDQPPTENHSHEALSNDSAPRRRQLGSYLLEAGLINDAQIEVVLNDQQMMTEMRFGEVLVVRGWIKPETIDFVMRRVVEPDRAYQEQPIVDKNLGDKNLDDKNRPTSPPEVRSPSFPTSPPKSKVVARARSVNGDFEIDIVEERSQNLPLTTPLIRSTDSGQSRNDRKSLPSTSDGDGVNWAG